MLRGFTYYIYVFFNMLGEGREGAQVNPTTKYMLVSNSVNNNGQLSVFLTAFLF